MKNLYLILLIVLNSFSFSQILLEQNCNNFTLGNVSSGITTTVVGQGGWRVFAPVGTALSNFQIVNVNAPYGNVFQMEGATTGPVARYIYNPSLGASWSNRTLGNEIIEFEYDLFTGTNTTSDTSIDFTIYDTTTTKALCGIDYTPLGQVLYGVAYGSIGGNGSPANLYVDPPTPIYLLPNSWYRLGASFNKTTGQVLFKGIVDGVPFIFSFNGAAANLDAGEIDFINATQPNNSTPTTNQFDNVVVRATAISTFLNTASTQITIDNFSIYPNPANDFIKIASADNLKIKNVEVTDLNGRIIKSLKINELSDVDINLTTISKGIYLLKIYTDNGFVNKKIFKN